MNSRICELLNIEFPLVAFTHCRDVVVAVSKAGGCGVLGAVGMSPDQLEKELKWIDEHIDGKPYGVDVLIPNKMVGKDEKFDAETLAKMIPQDYAEFRADVLENNDIEASELRTIDTAGSGFAANTQSGGAKALLDVAFKHPISLIANALGVPPDWMLQMGKDNDVKVAANSNQTVRSRSRTGKHSRQLQSTWTDAWESEKAPEPLPMPLQPMVAEPALQKVNKLAASGHAGAQDLATYWVGQGVGLMNQSISASDVVQDFKEDFIEAYERLTGFFEE